MQHGHVGYKQGKKAGRNEMGRRKRIFRDIKFVYQLRAGLVEFRDHCNEFSAT
jgi:hypothetical protein